MGQPDPIDTRHRDLRIFCALMTYSVSLGLAYLAP